MRLLVRISVLVCGLTLAASNARADVYISPFVGVYFGGDAGGEFIDEAEERDRLAWGFAAGGMRAGAFGAEIDVAYTSDFFGTEIGDNSLLTIMPTAIIGIPLGGQRGPGLRPYATAGLGVIRRRINVGGANVLDDTDGAYSVGFGVMGFVATPVGFRADYRYFRNFSSDLIDLGNLEIRRGTFDFSRASAGIVFRF
jgi:opacity protein-like surface antigen